MNRPSLLARMTSLVIFTILIILLAAPNLRHATVGATILARESLPAVPAQFETHPVLSEPAFATLRATLPMTATTTLTELPLQVERTQVWLPLIRHAPSERTAIWQPLVNTQQGYRLWYPSTGKATLYQPEGVLHILVDHATSPLVVQMFANPDQLSLEEWLDSPSNHRSAATAAACQHLVVNQHDACAYRLFAGDHWNTHLLLTYATDVYEFIYPFGGSQEGVFADIVATFIPGLAPDATDQGFTLIDREAAPPMLAQEIAPISVPYFNQGDARWASHRLGTCSVTIGSHGCAMTSMAMLFNYYQPSFTDPAALNQCLTNKGGYLNGCLLYWRNQCMPAGVTYSGSGDIDTELRNRRPVIVGVDGGAHWVVVIGRRSDGRYTINNPSSYSTSTLGPSVLDPGRISDIRRYNGTVPPPPEMAIDNPAHGASVNRDILIRGWAMHRAAASGTGVDAVHIYFDGPAGSGAHGVAATYGTRRDDLAAAHGERFRYVGFEFVINSAQLSLGQHTLYVYARSTVTGEWQLQTRTFTVVNIPPNMPTHATPANGVTLVGPTVTFTWNDAGDPDNRPRDYRDYVLQVINSAGTVVAEMPWAATTRWQTNLADGAYTWRLQAGDGAEGSGWSSNWSFTVRTIYTVSGQVTDANGAGLAGVTVSDGTRSATTNAEGAYTLNNVPPGTYTLTPTKEGYRFEPATRNVTVNGNVTGQNFAARLLTYTVSGQVTDANGAGLAGV
ncbi:carboxypeptidase regulatory-like domain-containing protein, partial [Candidatus Chloroploca sp. M-50]